MSGKKEDQLIRLGPRTELAQDVAAVLAAFLVDGEARGLSNRTVQFYADELRYLQGFLNGKNNQCAHSVSPPHLRQ